MIKNNLKIKTIPVVQLQDVNDLTSRISFPVISHHFLLTTLTAISLIYSECAWSELNLFLINLFKNLVHKFAHLLQKHLFPAFNVPTELMSPM